MSNMKVGGRVYRDIEKMDLDGLAKVRRALVQAIAALNKAASTIGRTPVGAARIGKLEGEQQILLRRLTIVDSLAKQIIKKAPVEEVQKYNAGEIEDGKTLAASTAELFKLVKPDE